uniref:C-type lectin domain-containing protein n=1 Tax=Biomphalaria glabrata TaxID=6526 RepID=A0A2C9M192_BIOGL
MSILHSVSVEKPDFKYLCSFSSFNQKIIQKHSPSLKSVNGTMDPIEGSHVSLIFEDPNVRKTGLYKCEVIGFDVEQGKPVIESKEFLVDASDIKIETVIGKIRNETLLIRESLLSLQSESINSTEKMKELQSSIDQFKLDMNESVSGLEADHDKTMNIIQNITAFSNEFHNNLKSLNTSVSGLENNLKDVKTKFDKVEILVNDSRKELDNVKNKSVSEDFIQKALQTMESSITQQKNFTQSAVDKSEAVKKRQDDMEGRLSKLDSGSKSFTQKPIESLFIGSSPFKGRRYWLTRKSYSILITDAETMCLRYGGYLLEIDSQEEFNFVRTFIQKNSAFTCVYTGGTDSLSENIWVHRFSLLKMKALNWHNGEPNNHVKEEHCECFFKAYNYFMNDCKCDFERHGNCGFICEIPEFDQDIPSSISLGS